MTTVLHAPVTVELKIGVTNGELDAEITWSMPPGRFPTPQEMQDGIREALTNAPEGFRLQTKPEWWDGLCVERFGVKAALLGGPEWDVAPKGKETTE